MRQFFSRAVIMTLLLLTTSRAALAANQGVSLGVNVYDPYFAPPHYGHEDKLAPQEWHDRLPFYAQVLGPNQVEVRDDNQEDIDKQIRYASAAGIDYFSFVYWDFQGLDPRATNPQSRDMNHFLRFYLSSAYKNQIKFALTVSAAQVGLATNLDNWDQSLLPHLVPYFKDPQYMTVLNGRPLLFMMQIDDLRSAFVKTHLTESALKRLRSKVIASNLPNPYIVGFAQPGFETISSLHELGFDAMGSYSMHEGSSYNDGQLWPFQQLVLNNRNYWNIFGAESLTVGINFIPTASVGFDYRPNLTTYADSYTNSPLYEQPRPNELKSHIANAINWVANHKSANPAQTLYLYSWAEFPEGSWLTPTLSEGDIRLAKIAEAQGLTYIPPVFDNSTPSPSPHLPGDLDGDGDVNIYDYNILVANFGNPYTIYDYNLLVANFGQSV